MKESPNTSKVIFRIIFWMMIYCFFTLTAGRFTPIYFEDMHIRNKYYCIVLIFLFITTAIVCFSRYYRSGKNNRIYIALCSIIIALGPFLILGFFTAFSLFAVWTDAATIYTKKDNPRITIVSRYINLGGWGGGTSPKDYEIVLKRSVTSFLKIETSIDTTKINKSDWVRNYYKRQ